MKKSICYIFSLIAFAAIIAGCSGGGSSASAASPPQAVTSASLPPDPGAAGKATIAGIDGDNDGVRDDVQHAIAGKFGSSQKKMAAARQHAKGVQGILTATNKTEALAAAELMLRAVSCASETDDNFAEITRPTTGMVVNTKERMSAYQLSNELVAGSVLKSPSGGAAELCDINPAMLPN